MLRRPVRESQDCLIKLQEAELAWSLSLNRRHSCPLEARTSSAGWSFTIYEELWNYGFPQEFAHFVDCVQNDKEPLETGEDGRAVLEAIFAAYHSAGIGQKVILPFASDAAKPWDLWKSGAPHGTT